MVKMDESKQQRDNKTGNRFTVSEFERVYSKVKCFSGSLQ